LEKVKTFPCENCGEALCDRSGNKIVVGNLEVELPRSRNIKCRRCGHLTRFCIDRKHEIRHD
jgi:RNase P subunit RPR2